jgi:hypothetical protein
MERASSPPQMIESKEADLHIKLLHERILQQEKSQRHFLDNLNQLQKIMQDSICKQEVFYQHDHYIQR